ncbi:rhodanese-like domain-containing protein [Oryzomonas sagensis]|uniref:Rhodanese-like domain-containing protein n=1 Tax=Oryzomonas sagensis TaxID=2603857 RepID=A0ABQ6TTH7_9BACT|nr:rhodanese-like domain-containing protein [Oryzomonas sagensis]KAB0672230.1 rhodanese-like domain-containing protein [Oryzomonas sagensis]
MKMAKTMFMYLTFVLALYVATAFGAGRESVVIDVRTEAEWNTGHVEGARLLPHERIGESIGTVAGDKRTRIYLYCRTGRRTALAFDVLKKAGYEDIINLGTVENAAKELGRPIVK